MFGFQLSYTKDWSLRSCSSENKLFHCCWWIDEVLGSREGRYDIKCLHTRLGEKKGVWIDSRIELAGMWKCQTGLDRGMTSNIPLQHQSSALGFKFGGIFVPFPRILTVVMTMEIGLNGFFLYKELPVVVRLRWKASLKNRFTDLKDRCKKFRYPQASSLLFDVELAVCQKVVCKVQPPDSASSFAWFEWCCIWLPRYRASASLVNCSTKYQTREDEVILIFRHRVVLLRRPGLLSCLCSPSQTRDAERLRMRSLGVLSASYWLKDEVEVWMEVLRSCRCWFYALPARWLVVWRLVIGGWCWWLDCSWFAGAICGCAPSEILFLDDSEYSSSQPFHQHLRHQH